MNEEVDLNKLKGCFYGLIVGDAVGTTLEFKKKDSFEPIIDMVGGGPFKLNPGEWTDDTSMTLALADSLVRKKGFDPSDIMDGFVDWWLNGAYSHNHVCFDIGNATIASLQKYTQTSDPYAGATTAWSSGNGSIMRLAPIPIWYRNNIDDCLYYCEQQSRLTHASTECLDCSMMLGEILFNLTHGWEIDLERYKVIPRNDVGSTGYVVDTLHAAKWAVANTNNFRDAILLAVNLGEDADTNGAVTGQIAGAMYGYDSIPEEWINKLAMKNYIDDLFEQLVRDDTIAVGAHKIII